MPQGPQGLSAIVLCAGKGTRMKSEKAKVLHALLGRPLCFYPITRVLELGASPVVAVIGHQADQAKATLEALFPGRPLRFALQKEQNGTAGAVRAAEAELQGRRAPILILYGDLPLVRTETLQSLIDVFHSGKSKLALTAMKLDDPTGYGRLVRFRGAITRVVEHKDCTPAQLRISECNAGIYVVDAAFLWKSIHQTKSSNAQRELYLTDLVEMAAADGEVASITVSAEEAAGVNDRQDLAAAGAVLQSRINSHLMRSGVTLVDPRSTFIAEGIDIGPDTEIAPMVTVFGQSRIGSNVRIGQGCVVINSEIADETELHPYCVMNGAQIGRRCSIGPFARLRPGSQLEEAVHLGNFVETKKTRIGKGSKANHLSYLGDAEIGAGVNVGAGTITCNYDGEHKYKTVLGDGVFVGSDTQFVAPVTVGEGAYIAAGTTVTEDVPARSLVLSRTRQTVKEGWVDAKKAKKGEGASQKSGQMGESRSTPASEHPVRASEPPKR